MASPSFSLRDFSSPRKHDQESVTPPAICQDPAILTGDSGTITSPGYPNRYKDNLRCSWTITVSRGRAAIRFTSIDIQGHSTCAYDYLTVYDGANSSGTQLGKFCGKTIPPPVVASGKTRHLVFISDSLVNGQGFSIEYVGKEMLCLTSSQKLVRVSQSTGREFLKLLLKTSRGEP
ncbi:PREDICTED: procollagen C-endopeptidase enhancer 1-like [Branchiostoma belcheri]|uniref:Procollagen C-endopeptidase enhancer 1-like n=1 Tax=Branchiostoma belcheri TaxID=7741 RepID=A0A6P4ZET4_BRABE|nr:PREDICTED: procollagen C-endopeptidase enhancer 1-like [Branchiostoma belcheri]